MKKVLKKRDDKIQLVCDKPSEINDVEKTLPILENQSKECTEPKISTNEVTDQELCPLIN